MTAAAQLAVFPLVSGSKTPAVPWGAVKPGQYPAVGNHGIALQPDDLIVDFDPWKYPVGRSMWDEFFACFPYIRTRVVKTPRGGFHVYLKIPAGVAFTKDQPDWPGIDFLSAGCYVCGPGTATVAGKDRGTGTYELLGDIPIADAPVELLASLRVKTEKAVTTGAGETLSREADFIRDCDVWDAPTKGSRGIESYKLACHAKDLGLPLDVAYQHMRDVWLPRWQEPFTESELYTQVKRAYQYAQNATGSKAVEAFFTPEMATPLAIVPSKSSSSQVASLANHQNEARKLQIENLQVDNKGNPTDCLANVVSLLKTHAAWRNVFQFNTFSGSLELATIPEWRQHDPDGLEIEKRDLANIQVWFSANCQLEVSESKIVAALETAEVSPRVHPPREWLNSLVWDKTPRLDRLLVDTAGAKDSVANREIGRILGLSAVARIMDPGCKQDHVVILEGAQGLRKSLWISTLGGKWSSTGMLVRGDKDTYQNMRGWWIIELPEINATFSKSDFNWLKGIISTPVDVYRASYARVAKPVKRQSIFIGSINPGASIQYLKDDENRRYLPVTVGQMNVERLAQDRDQYFAEAMHRYMAGEKIWTIDPATAKAIKAEQEARKEQDPWCIILRDWLNARPSVTAPEVFVALGLSGGNIGSHHLKRFYTVMNDLGYAFDREFGAGGTWKKAHVTWEDV